MPVSFEFIVVFFIYGLAFFTMGLGLTLQAGRSPLLAEQQSLRPLAVFGFIHGFHEWFEMFLLFRTRFDLPVPGFANWMRIIFLLASFISLFYYALLVLRIEALRPRKIYLLILLASLGAYLLVVMFSSYLHEASSGHAMEHADALARYLLAAPGAFLAALALGRQARHAATQERAAFSHALSLAAWGFGGYALTQLVVPQVDFFPAIYLNTTTFLALVGLPIQVFRALLAVLVTIGLLRATQVLDVERQRAFLNAQEARVEALQQVQRELAARESLRRELLRYTVIAQEDERSRIARELHDETAQFLTALSLDIATLRKSIEPHSQVQTLLDRLQRLSRDMAAGIHRMVHDLRPAQLDDLGLVAAIQYLVDEARRSGLEADLQIDGVRQRLDPLVETVCFRVTQEAINNVIRHAHARHVVIRLEYVPGQVGLTVKDDGCGFQLDQVIATRRGWGLAGMQERVEALGGHLRIDSFPGNGTTVNAQITWLPAWSQEEIENEKYPHHVGG